MSTFDDAKFEDAYPVAFLMREVIGDAWFRIHSLPESKRYPENVSEWKMLLERHRAVADSVLREGSRCRVHYTLFNESGFPEDLVPKLHWSCAKAQRCERGETVYTQTAETNWNFDTFRPWIILRSDHTLGWLSFHSLETDAIYAPYDGGADMFSLDAAFMADIRSRFSAWRSPHPTGV